MATVKKEKENMNLPSVTQILQPYTERSIGIT
jgi:hypothetical protein